MGGLTRHQEYKYQYKTIALQNARDCGPGATLNFNLPSNLLEVKNLWTHISIVFHASEPAQNRKIVGIGPRTNYVDPLDQPLMKPLNLTADANRRIDFTYDLTEIIKDLVINEAGFGYQGSIPIGILHPEILTQIATIEIWKMDLVYTTQGIR
jgi:hypothetical protein